MRFGIRELVFVLAMLGLLGSSYFLVFQKSNLKRDALRADVESKRKALLNLRQATAGIEDLGKKIDELQKAIEFFESKLPQEQEIDKILKEVWQMAEANSLTTRTVKTMKAERSAGYSELPIQMNLSGDFNGFYSFLLQLEKLPRITRLTHMNLQKIDERDGEMTANMTLSIFFEPDPSVVSAAR
ncbi:MAG: type 4a pilus biogenesis protein PilO [Phycisphaerae bacterium]|nr:type 4a pilus biogenesis protein PilO [Phycisphaerae bacterium]MDW8261777.1 type 4a pilus biogenesis protein PilO [Phycisphaerales bacterium]